VHIFDEPNPIAFLYEVKPDVHVNGSEYGERCIEADVVRRSGGEVRAIQRIPGLSTSTLLATLQGRLLDLFGTRCSEGKLRNDVDRWSLQSFRKLERRCVV
jgi:hypothetical protein